MSRDIKRLHPLLLPLYAEFSKQLALAGIAHIVTSTVRTLDEQAALYAQGRRNLVEVNVLRRAVGMYPLSAAENEYCVTWTMKSRHFPQPIDLSRSDYDPNGYSRAFDIALLRSGRRSAHWDLKVSVNGNDIPDYAEAGGIGELVGLDWGGRWRKPDHPHYQMARLPE
jgi:peptidoglycan L-alanyl-D-glutamate endopeptidase CwlK